MDRLAKGPLPEQALQVCHLDCRRVRQDPLPTADGQQFFVTTAGDEVGAPITAVLNWTAGLKR